MNDEDLERFRKLLQSRLDALIAKGDARIAPNRTSVETVPDEDEQPLNEMNQIIASNRNRENAATVRLLRAALTRLASDPDDFGYCATCDDPIPAARLELIPWARYCVACKAKVAPRRDGRRRHLTDFD